jgi:hypothetical protein
MAGYDAAGAGAGAGVGAGSDADPHLAANALRLRTSTAAPMCAIGRFDRNPVIVPSWIVAIVEFYDGFGDT